MSKPEDWDRIDATTGIPKPLPEQRLDEIIDAELSKAGYKPRALHRTEFYSDFQRVAKAVYADAIGQAMTPPEVAAEQPEPYGKGWIVIIGSGSWATCYGVFESYDAVMAWVRENQFNTEDANVLPISQSRIANESMEPMPNPPGSNGPCDSR